MAREMKRDDDDEPIVKENFRTIPMESIEHGTLAMAKTLVDTCSKPGTEPNTIRLITIGFSHYCEKVSFIRGSA